MSLDQDSTGVILLLENIGTDVRETRREVGGMRQEIGSLCGRVGSLEAQVKFRSKSSPPPPRGPSWGTVVKLGVALAAAGSGIAAILAVL